MIASTDSATCWITTDAANPIPMFFAIVAPAPAPTPKNSAPTATEITQIHRLSRAMIEFTFSSPFNA